jgi:hypothetical protein
MLSAGGQRTGDLPASVNPVVVVLNLEASGRTVDCPRRSGAGATASVEIAEHQQPRNESGHVGTVDVPGIPSSRSPQIRPPSPGRQIGSGMGRMMRFRNLWRFRVRFRNLINKEGNVYPKGNFWESGADRGSRQKKDPRDEGKWG